MLRYIIIPILILLYLLWLGSTIKDARKKGSLWDVGGFSRFFVIFNMAGLVIISVHGLIKLWPYIVEYW